MNDDHHSSFERLLEGRALLLGTRRHFAPCLLDPWRTHVDRVHWNIVEWTLHWPTQHHKECNSTSVRRTYAERPNSIWMHLKFTDTSLLTQWPYTYRMIRTRRDALDDTYDVLSYQSRSVSHPYLGSIPVQNQRSNVIGVTFQFHQQRTSARIVDTNLGRREAWGWRSKSNEDSSYHIFRRPTCENSARWIHRQTINGMIVASECRGCKDTVKMSMRCKGELYLSRYYSLQSVPLKRWYPTERCYCRIHHSPLVLYPSHRPNIWRNPWWDAKRRSPKVYLLLIRMPLLYGFLELTYTFLLVHSTVWLLHRSKPTRLEEDRTVQRVFLFIATHCAFLSWPAQYRWPNRCDVPWNIHTCPTKQHRLSSVSRKGKRVLRRNVCNPRREWPNRVPQCRDGHFSDHNAERWCHHDAAVHSHFVSETITRKIVPSSVDCSESISDGYLPERASSASCNRFNRT